MSPAQTTSYRFERDQKKQTEFRHSIIFSWTGREGENPFPSELPMIIGDKKVVYKPVRQ